MEITSVSTSGAALQQQYTATKTQSEYPEQTRTREEPVRTNETQSTTVQNVEASAVAAQERNEQPERAEAPKVFVNAQGQKTGTIINVTA
ncbi:MAG: hypothetical protein AB1443_05260 [Pseudomonadota bacterium]